MKSFWDNLPTPFFVLAPLADVTDAAFRRVIAKYSAHVREDGTIGGPDVMWTEFVSADGLVCADDTGKQKLLADLVYSEEERPIVAQLFSSDPENMEQAARLVAELGFDGLDINMGCPDRSIERQGAGAAHIKDPARAASVISAARRGVKSSGRDIPVSVKTRIGYNKSEIDEWIPVLLGTGIAALSIHLRTRKEMSNVPAHWELAQRLLEIRKAVAPDVRLIGNGDVLDISDAKRKAEEYGLDGTMLGRAIFGNPWLFHPEKDSRTVSLREKLAVVVEHTRLFEELLPHKNFAVMKKHYKAYVNGFDGAAQLRALLMEATNAEEVAVITERFAHLSVA